MAASKERGKAAAAEEGVSGLMKRLQIAEESKVVCIGSSSGSKKASLNQAIGKLFSEKAARAVNLEDTLCNIGCQLGGTTC